MGRFSETPRSQWHRGSPARPGPARREGAARRGEPPALHSLLGCPEGTGPAAAGHLPPLTPNDGSSLAAPMATTIPTMNHSFLALSSSLIFLRAGGFCSSVRLAAFPSRDPCSPGASPHFPRPLQTCSGASQIATRKLQRRLGRLRGGLGVVVSSDRKASLGAAITTTRLRIDAHSRRGSGAGDGERRRTRREEEGGETGRRVRRQHPPPCARGQARGGPRWGRGARRPGRPASSWGPPQ